jgi:hypothetical protein
LAGQVKMHETGISIVKLGIAELEAGASVQLRVRLSCSDFCDLRGKTVNIIAPDSSIKEIVLTGFNGAENVADDFVVETPNQPALYTWTAVFPAQEKGDIVHLESSARMSFEFKPHLIGIAVWDVPSPIVVGASFRVKVGVRCSADCRLAGKMIEIYGHDARRVATETLGGDPWPGTDALYWAEVELQATGTVGYYEWTVAFPEQDATVEHQASVYTFGFRTVLPPECLVTVEAVDKTTKTPIGNARVILAPYSGFTDEHGVAIIEVAKGDYSLYISEVGRETFRTTVKVDGDVAVRAELSVAPHRDEDG